MLYNIILEILQHVQKSAFHKVIANVNTIQKITIKENTPLEIRTSQLFIKDCKHRINLNDGSEQKIKPSQEI